MNSRANVRPYNAQVLIGNWYEDRVMEQVDTTFFHHFEPNFIHRHLGSLKWFSWQTLFRSISIAKDDWSWANVSIGMLKSIVVLEWFPLFSDAIERLGKWWFNSFWSTDYSGEYMDTFGTIYRREIPIELLFSDGYSARFRCEWWSNGTNRYGYDSHASDSSFSVYHPKVISRSVFLPQKSQTNVDDFRPNLSVDSQPIRYGDEILLSDINGQVIHLRYDRILLDSFCCFSYF